MPDPSNYKNLIFIWVDTKQKKLKIKLARLKSTKHLIMDRSASAHVEMTCPYESGPKPPCLPSLSMHVPFLKLSLFFFFFYCYSIASSGFWLWAKILHGQWFTTLLRSIHAKLKISLNLTFFTIKTIIQCYGFMFCLCLLKIVFFVCRSSGNWIPMWISNNFVWLDSCYKNISDSLQEWGCATEWFLCVSSSHFGEQW